jgi:1,4-alpha-glucan branching enzyme
MGQEFGQLAEWSESRTLDWWLLDQPSHAQLQRFVGAMNGVYRGTAPLWERDNDSTRFRRLGAPVWDPNVIAFERRDLHGGRVIVISNFAGVERPNLELDLPVAGVWEEILNTDAAEYGGAGIGNYGRVAAHASGDHGAPRAKVTLPPLSTLWLRYRPERSQRGAERASSGS